MRSLADLGILFGSRCRMQGWLRRNVSNSELSGHDLEALSGGPHPGQPQLMPERLERLGIDPAYVKLFHTSTYQDLQRVCASCKDWRRCTRDLARGDVQSGMESYCLNAPCIDALLVERPPWEESP